MYIQVRDYRFSSRLFRGGALSRAIAFFRANSRSSERIICNAIQYNTIQCNAMQCNTIQYNVNEWNLKHDEMPRSHTVTHWLSVTLTWTSSLNCHYNAIHEHVWTRLNTFEHGAPGFVSLTSSSLRRNDAPKKVHSLEFVGLISVPAKRRKEETGKGGSEERRKRGKKG